MQRDGVEPALDAGLPVKVVEVHPGPRVRVAGHSPEDDPRVRVLRLDRVVRDPNELRVSVRRRSRWKRLPEVLLVPNLPGGDRADGSAGEQAPITRLPELASGTVPIDRGRHESSPAVPGR